MGSAGRRHREGNARFQRHDAKGGRLKRILFVDDEPKVLDGLRRMLHSMRDEWEMTFVESAGEALRILADTECDVLVTDIRMPEMSGLELLSQVVKRYPQVVRMVLSGTVDQEITLRSTAIAHQFLVKPCNPETLRATVEHALNNRLMLENPALKQLISRMPSLPSNPAVHLQLMDALRAPGTTDSEIGAIIARDIGMTAKVLQLANSEVFGKQRQITNPREAVAYLGTEVVRSLALTLSVFSQFEGGRIGDFSIEELHEHGLAVGSLARRMAQSLGLPQTHADDCFVGGVLHDLGKLVLASNYPNYYGTALMEARQRQLPLTQLETDTLGTTHPEVGAYLLWLWGIPDCVTEIVALHHTPPVHAGPHSHRVALVHTADALVNRRIEDVNRESLAALGLAGKLSEWKQFREELRAEGPPWGAAGRPGSWTGDVILEHDTAPR